MSCSCDSLSGTNTAANALTYITYFIGSNATVAANLRAELALKVNDESKYDVDLLRSLPYMNAVIRVRQDSTLTHTHAK